MKYIKITDIRKTPAGYALQFERWPVADIGAGWYQWGNYIAEFNGIAKVLPPMMIIAAIAGLLSLL